MDKNPLETQNTSEQASITVEIAQESDWEVFKDIRIEALTKNPEAFGSSLEEALKRTSDEWQEDLSNDPHFFVLAKADTSPQGAKSMAGAYKREAGRWRLVGVYTRPEFRKSGLAEQVLNKILEEIKKRGGVKVQLGVMKGPKQEAARTMYKKFNFKEIEEFEKSYLMEKDL